MEFLNFLAYYLIVDIVLSLVVFGLLYCFRKDLLNRIRLRLQNFLGISYLVDKVECIEEEVYEEIKPTMKKAMDDVFKLGDNQ